MLLETQMPDILHRGKVRDTYGLGGGHLLMVATDRISAFDVVLPTGIADKGLVLNRISAFWFERTKDIVANHFICLADSEEADQYLEGSTVASAIFCLPAYQIVQTDASRSWEEGLDFRDLLRADRQVGEYLSQPELDELFDYGYYTRYVDDTFARLGLVKQAAKKKKTATASG